MADTAQLQTIAKVLQSWSESSWGRDPPSLDDCRDEIKKWSSRIGQVLEKLADAQKAREATWLKLFEANDDPLKELRTATEKGTYNAALDKTLKDAAQSSEDTEKELARAETVVAWWRRELARVQGKKCEYEFWREYHLTRDEAQQFAFAGGYGSGGGGYSAAQLQRMDERIRRINRSLPTGFKPIPSINVQTIMYVPSSVPGQYLPATGR